MAGVTERNLRPVQPCPTRRARIRPRPPRESARTLVRSGRRRQGDPARGRDARCGRGPRALAGRREMRRLRAKAQQVLERAQRDAELHRARCELTRRPGQTHHLDRRPSEERYFSMLSPAGLGRQATARASRELPPRGGHELDPDRGRGAHLRPLRPIGSPLPFFWRPLPASASPSSPSSTRAAHPPLHETRLHLLPAACSRGGSRCALVAQGGIRRPAEGTTMASGRRRATVIAPPPPRAQGWATSVPPVRNLR